MSFNIDNLNKIRDERLKQLEKQDRELNSSSVQLFWEDVKKRDPVTTEQFFMERQIKKGCDNLQTQIDNLNDEVAFLNVISRVTGILSRMLLLF